MPVSSGQRCASLAWRSARADNSIGIGSSACLQRHLGSTGLKVSRLGLGTLTWGTDTDEHEAQDQLRAFVDAGGTLIDTAAGYGGGASEEMIGSLLSQVVDRDNVVIATKGGISRRSGERVVDVSRGALAARSRHVAGPARGRLRRPVAGPHLVLRRTAGRDTDGTRRRGVQWAGAIRRHLQLLRLADRTGRHAPTVRRRPGPTGLHPGRVLAAAARNRARGGSGRRGARTRDPARGHRSVAAC